MAPDLTSPATLGREGEGSRINLGVALYWPILNPITVTRGVAYPDLLEPIIAPPGAVMKGIKGCGVVGGGSPEGEVGVELPEVYGSWTANAPDVHALASPCRRRSPALPLHPAGTLMSHWLWPAHSDTAGLQLLSLQINLPPKWGS